MNGAMLLGYFSREALRRTGVQYLNKDAVCLARSLPSLGNLTVHGNRGASLPGERSFGYVHQVDRPGTWIHEGQPPGVPAERASVGAQ